MNLSYYCIQIISIHKNRTINRIQNPATREVALGMIKTQEALHNLQRDKQTNKDSWECVLEELKSAPGVDNAEKQKELRTFETTDAQLQKQIEETMGKLEQYEIMLRK